MLPSSRAMIVVPLLAVALAACGGTTAGTPMPTVSEPGTASPSPDPTDSGSPSPTPTVAPTTPPGTPAAPAIGVDSVVRTLVADLRLRQDPTTGAASLGTLAQGAQSYVVDGPVAADGYTWYLLSGLGIPQYSGCAGPIVTDPWECPVWFGWAAAGSADGDAWLAEDDLECPTWPDVANDDIILGVQRIAYLACFGGEERTLTGFYPLIPDDAGLGGACADVPDDMAWIGCNLGYEHLNAAAADPFGSGFVFSVDTDEVDMPERGQWIRISGRFDHPAADACTFGDDPSESVLQCRAQFVAESVQAVAAP